MNYVTKTGVIRKIEPGFVQGNTQLGDPIWTWTLPAPGCCPCASTVCRKHCYAARHGGLAYAMRQNQLKYRLNYEKSLGDNFVAWARDEIRRNRMGVVRWNDGGDCYSARYVQKICRIVEATPQTIHYLYTRCWQRPDILQELLKLARLPNAWIWFSFDRSMPVPPQYPRVRLCYLAEDGESPPVEVDRIFPLLPRNLKKGETIPHRVFTNGPVCPYKNGTNTGITCNICPTACWKGPIDSGPMPTGTNATAGQRHRNAPAEKRRGSERKRPEKRNTPPPSPKESLIRPPRNQKSKCRTTIRHGDVLAVTKKLDASTFDGCLFDGPYGLTSIGKRFGKPNSSPATTALYRGFARGFMGQTWDGSVPSVEVYQELLRVCKPGSWMLAFGHPRTWHRLACNIEDAGWDIRDTLMWLFGQGFPKSHNLGRKMTDAAWNAYGFALKPGFEPIILAMKPLDGSFANNARKWGVAGLNIDGCRLGDDAITINQWKDGSKPFGGGAGHPYETMRSQGRYPANVLFDEEAAAILDEQTAGKVGNGHWPDCATTGYGKFGGGTSEYLGPGRKDRTKAGASRFFYCPKASTKERNAGLDDFPIDRPDKRTGKALGIWDDKGIQPQRNPHPCVKPIKLTEWLARLILPPERPDPRRILVPYCGSGSEMIGAMLAGWEDVLGIEREEQYIEIAKVRLRWWRLHG